MSTSTSKPETDIILNRANVALARSQRLVASWLPPKTPAEGDSSAVPKSEEELRREEEEIFTAVPETLGLGAPLPQKLPDGSWNRAELDSNDQLRRQLLGKNYQKVMKEKAAAQEAKLLQQKQQSAATTRTTGDHANKSGAGEDDDDDDDDDDDEEEEGRTSAIGKKSQSQGQMNKNQKNKNRKKKRKAEAEGVPHPETPAATLEPAGDNQGKQDGEEGGEDSGKQGQASSQPGPRGRKKATSFLDEILAERSKKRKKR